MARKWKIAMVQNSLTVEHQKLCLALTSWLQAYLTQRARGVRKYSSYSQLDFGTAWLQVYLNQSAKDVRKYLNYSYIVLPTFHHQDERLSQFNSSTDVTDDHDGCGECDKYGHDCHRHSRSQLSIVHCPVSTLTIQEPDKKSRGQNRHSTSFYAPSKLHVHMVDLGDV